MNPQDYPKRVLVAVSGLSPQILTETLYGLAVATQPAFIPTEVHLITTEEGAHIAELNLLHPKDGYFHALCREYQLHGIQFDANHIHVIEDANGSPLSDIRTPEQNAAAADFITHTLCDLTRDDDSAIHVSIAGGRKTMGYYVGYALSLFGREQDRLSHVLVSPEYEGHPEFYYPTVESHRIQTRGDRPRPLDTSKAKIVLAEIPFIRLRQDIPNALLKGKAGFLQTIEQARKAELPPALVINLTDKTLTASGIEVKLQDILLAFYVWLLEETLKTQEALAKPTKFEPNMEYKNRFLSVYERIVTLISDKTENGLRKGMDDNFFAEKITRINQALDENLGKRLAQSYRIFGSKHAGIMAYQTPLSPEQVKILVTVNSGI